MSEYNVGQSVYRRTINDKVLAPWKIVAIRKGWFRTEYLLKHSLGSSQLVVVEQERNLFPVPEAGELPKEES